MSQQEAKGGNSELTVLRFFARCQHDERHLDALCLFRVNHGRVSFRSNHKRIRVPRRNERDDLAAPAELVRWSQQPSPSPSWNNTRQQHTPRTPHDLIEGYLASSALTNPGSFSATPPGGFLPKKAPRFFCFSALSGGYLCSCRSEEAVIGDD